MSRFGGLSEERPSDRPSETFRPEASLILIYRPNVAGMKGRVDLAQPVNRTPDLWCVKLYTTTRSYSCINRIVMTQTTHVDDFVRGRIIGHLESKRTQVEVSEELGIAPSIISMLWQRLQDNDNGNRRFSTDCPLDATPNEKRYIWELLPKETDGAQYQTCLAISPRPLVR
ncbi:uncharacterized protein TNCV_693511 [Trichonephila clavipes]|nr:uncharacterized protein TNCV_693511 [Trichonephila clavipes]